MRLRATIKIRNEHMLAARQRLGMSQKVLAAAAAVPINWVWAFEKLDYSKGQTNDLAVSYAAALADCLGLETSQVLPEELAGEKIETTRVAIADLPHSLLLSGACERFALPCPSEEAEASELKDMVAEMLDTLTFREREIVKMLYGIGGGCIYTLEEVGRTFGITRERARQVRIKTEGKLAHPIRSSKVQGCL